MAFFNVQITDLFLPFSLCTLIFFHSRGVVSTFTYFTPLFYTSLHYCYNLDDSIDLCNACNNTPVALAFIVCSLLFTQSQYNIYNEYLYLCYKCLFYTISYSYL